MKKIISGIIGTSIIANTLIPFTSSAKVIKPEIVKTETWTTSYYIDDDMDTLYPYIDCQADINNDGTVQVHFWNTHEWDGFATVRHKVKIINATPRNDLTNYTLYFSNTPSVYTVMAEPFSLDYFPNCYTCTEYPFGVFNCDYGNDFYVNMFDYKVSTGIYTYEGSLPNLPVGNYDDRLKNNILTFTPNVDPTGIYNFRILGHEFTVTPEILSGNIVAEPILTDTEKLFDKIQLPFMMKIVKKLVIGASPAYLTYMQSIS